MPFVPIPSTAMFEIRYELFGQNVENTLWFEEAVAWNTSALNEQCAVLADWVVTYLFPTLSTDITLREVFGTSMESDTAPTGSFAFATPPAGDVPTASEPGNVAYALTFRTGNRGRSFRGRNYVMGIPLSSVVGNQVTSAFRNTVVGAYQQLSGDIPEILGTWVVASRFSGGAPRTVGVTTPITVVATADLNLDSQRRRLTGRGT